MQSESRAHALPGTADSRTDRRFHRGPSGRPGTSIARGFFLAGSSLLAATLLAASASAQEAKPAPAAAKTSEAAARQRPGGEKKAADDVWTPARLETGVTLKSLQLPKTAPQRPVLPAVQHPVQSAVPQAGAQLGHPGHDEAGHEHGTPATLPATLPAQPTGPGGKITWEEGSEVHDFGKAVQGQVLEHTFRLKNEGEGDLVFSNIKPSCGCTVPQTMVAGANGEQVPYQVGQPIAPGAEVVMNVRLTTTGKRGPVTSQINLYTNDPRNVVTLSLKADVTPFLTVEPTHLNFARMTAAEKREDKLVITSPLVDRFKLDVNRAALPPELKVDVVPVDPDESGSASTWEVRVTLGPNLVEGNRSYPLQLMSDQTIEGAPPMPDGSPAVQQVSAYVIANVTGLVSADPPYLSYGLMRPGQVVSRVVTVENLDPNWEMPEPKVVIQGFQGDFPYMDAVSAVVRTKTPGKSYEVEVTIDGLPENLNASFHGIVAIQANHPTKEVLEVRFSGVHRSGVALPGNQVPPAQQGGSGH